MRASIYITDEIKAILDRVAELDHRALVDEIDYLVSRRLAELEDCRKAQPTPQQQNADETTKSTS